MIVWRKPVGSSVGPLPVPLKAAAKEPEWAPPGIVELEAMMRERPGLSIWSVQSVRSPVSKPPF